MWRAGMWYGDEKTTTLSYLRNVGIVFAAFLATGIIYVVLQRSMDSMTRRVTNTYKTGDDAGATPTFATTPATAGAPMANSPAVPMAAAPRPLNYYAGGRATQPLMPASTQPAPFATPNIPAAFILFPNDSERYKAQSALADLRVAVADFNEYNSKGLQKSLALARSGSSSSVPLMNSFNSEEDADGKNGLAQETEQNARQQIAIDRVQGETEALGAALSLTAHPDLFPESLRDPVGEVSRELHTYLQDVRYAVAQPEERSRLLSLASQHLSRGEQILSSIESVVGTSSGRSAP